MSSQNSLIKKAASGISRRSALKLTAAGLAAPAILGSWRKAYADDGTLRLLSEDTADVELAWYKQVNDAFKAKHPDVNVQLTTIDSSLMMEKLTNSIAANDPPDMVPGTLQERIATFAKLGVLRPVDDIIDKIGRDDFVKGSLENFQFEGRQLAVPLSNQFRVLWYRNDLAKAKNVKAPTNWDELLNWAKTFTGDNKYGIALAGGVNYSTCFMVLQFFRQGGGGILDEDGKVMIDSAANKTALEYMAELYQYSPPGSANYGEADLLKNLQTGTAAAIYYPGRVLQRMTTNAPELMPNINATIPPYSAKRFTSNGPRGTVIFADARSPDAAAEWALESSFGRESHIDWLLTAPGMFLPVRKSVAADPRFTGSPLLKERADVIAVLEEASHDEGNLYKETPNHKPNFRSGDVSASPILPTMLQKHWINKESSASALSWAQKQMEDLLAS